jgi:hypothetical protein
MTSTNSSLLPSTRHLKEDGNHHFNNHQMRTRARRQQLMCPQWHVRHVQHVHRPLHTPQVHRVCR